MKRQTLARRLIVLTVAFSGAGCAHIDYEVSAPLALPPGVSGKLHRTGEVDLVFAGFRLKLAGLDATLIGSTTFFPLASLGILLPVPMHNRIEPRPVPSLMLLFLFEAHRLGLSFNPMEVEIKLPDVGLQHPVSYIGPGQPSSVRVKYSHTERLCAGSRSAFKKWPMELPRETAAKNWPIPVGATCFVLAFNANVLGPQGVTVRIRGIVENEQPLVIPALDFVRQPARTWELVNARPRALQ